MFYKFHLGVHKTERPFEDVGLAEDDILAACLNLLANPLNSLKPDKFRRATTICYTNNKPLLCTYALGSDIHHSRPNLYVGGVLLTDLGDAIDACAVNVAEREVVEQVAKCAYTNLRGKQRGSSLPHPRQIFYIIGQFALHGITCYL